MDKMIQVTRISSVHRLNVARGKDFRKSRHTNGIAFKTVGKTVYTIDGKTHVSQPGKIILLGKGSSYHIDFVEPGECYIIDFETADDFLAGKIMSFSIGNTSVLSELLTDIERSFKYKRPYFEYDLISKIYNIFHHIFVNDRDGYMPKSKIKLLEPAIKYIEDNFTCGECDNQQLADIAGISVSYFRRLFQEVYRTSPAKYIQTLRLNKAKELLLDGKLSISEISEKAGFTSVYYFDNCFKKQTGMTPSQYIRSVITLL